ncbi:isocitrate lyase/PEP mutase family protein [Listeria booriae]|uniref:isocitrate lyase/PEP mutase family protein n=1 Tax=Listeria booriae TaxID=1552123 RepID=UPI0016248204|nr:isocitrate lyase/phosphoenolpyruvate mutase family protein [Listeria booriae]MBC2324008.1 isocitrate lyase/phosphoenolpyruvate mutase family protein [Listeria booriae]
MNTYNNFYDAHFQEEALILYNCWDVASAQAIEKAGARALATSSFAIARAWGFDDGEQLPFQQNLWFLEQIRRNTTLPLTIDIEAAYSNSLETLAANVAQFLNLGVQGINFEDRKQDTLWDISEQSERIHTIRKIAKKEVFLNARTDLFFQETHHTSDLVKKALERANAYKEAGADGIFIPGLTDLDLIQAFAEHSPLPVNIMINDDPNRYTNLKIARLSYGPASFLNAQKQLEKISHHILKGKKNR